MFISPKMLLLTVSALAFSCSLSPLSASSNKSDKEREQEDLGIGRSLASEKQTDALARTLATTTLRVSSGGTRLAAAMTSAAEKPAPDPTSTHARPATLNISDIFPHSKKAPILCLPQNPQNNEEARERQRQVCRADEDFLTFYTGSLEKIRADKQKLLSISGHFLSNSRNQSLDAEKANEIAALGKEYGQPIGISEARVFTFNTVKPGLDAVQSSIDAAYRKMTAAVAQIETTVETKRRRFEGGLLSPEDWIDSFTKAFGRQVEQFASTQQEMPKGNKLMQYNEITKLTQRQLVVAYHCLPRPIWSELEPILEPILTFPSIYCLLYGYRENLAKPGELKAIDLSDQTIYEKIPYMDFLTYRSLDKGRTLCKTPYAVIPAKAGTQTLSLFIL